MIGQLHDLSVRDKEYAILYAQCVSRFPNAITDIPKPEYRTGPSTVAYLYQAPAPLPPAPQQWNAQATAPAPAPAPQIANASTITSFFQTPPLSDGCAFCTTQDHRLRQCSSAKEYLVSGRASLVGDRIHLPNGQPIPFDGTRQGLKASIDMWLTTQNALTTAQTRTVFARDAPPHFDSHNTSNSRIEEVIESHILQVREATAPDDDEEEFSHDIFEVFAAEKKKRENKSSKALELSVPPPSTQASASGSGNIRPNMQYRYQSNAEDQQLVSKLEDYLLQGKLSLTTPAHVFAASPTICKNIVDKLKVRRMETNKYEVVPAQRPPMTIHEVTNTATIIEQPPDFCLPLQELDVLVNGVKVQGP